jgi:hypothetical protein
VRVDCVGVVRGVAKNLGLTDFDYTNYGRFPQPAMMERLLDEQLDRVARGAERPGDVPWMKDPWRGGAPPHQGC